MLSTENNYSVRYLCEHLFSALTETNVSWRSRNSQADLKAPEMQVICEDRTCYLLDTRHLGYRRFLIRIKRASLLPPRFFAVEFQALPFRSAWMNGDDVWIMAKSARQYRTFGTCNRPTKGL